MSAQQPPGDTPNSRLLDNVRDLVLNERMPYCEFAHRCRQRLCPVCASTSVRRVLRSYEDLIETYESCASIWFSIEDVDDFELAWSRLNAVARRWSSHVKSFEQVDAFVFSVEVTDNRPNWHIHGHAVIFGTNLPKIAKAAAQFWNYAADELDIASSPHGVGYAVDYSPRRALLYVLKSKLGYGCNSLRATLAAAADGDADALDRFHEVEQFISDHPRSRWRWSWRRPTVTPRREAKPKITRSTYDYANSGDMRLMMLADLLGVTSKAGQASLVTTGWDERKQDYRQLSTATIARIRRHPAYVRWRAAHTAVDGTQE